MGKAIIPVSDLVFKESESKPKNMVILTKADMMYGEAAWSKPLVLDCDFYKSKFPLLGDMEVFVLAAHSAGLKAKQIRSEWKKHVKKFVVKHKPSIVILP